MDETIIECVLKEIQKKYFFQNIELVKILNRIPLTLKISGNGRYFFVKVNNSIFSEKSIQFKYHIVEGLLDYGIMVPKLIATTENENYFMMGKNAVELYEWMEFAAYQENCFQSFFSTIDFLLKIREGLRSIYVPSKQDAQYREYVCKYIANEEFVIGEYSKKIKSFLPSVWDVFHELTQILQENTDRNIAEIRQMQFGFIHGDYNLKNIGYRDGKACIIMDLERSRKGFFVEDLAICLFELCIKNQNLNQIEDKINRFMEYILCKNVYIDEEMLLYVLTNRLLRHIYRGVDKMGEGQKVFDGFYEIFVKGLLNTYSYLKCSKP